MDRSGAWANSLVVVGILGIGYCAAAAATGARTVGSWQGAPDLSLFRQASSVPVFQFSTFPAPFWQLVGSPYTTSQSFTDLGLYAAAWSQTQNQYVTTPTPPADTFHPGQGYWVFAAQPVTLSQPVTPIDQTQPFSIALQSGWNMVSDPFTSSVPLSNLKIVSASGDSTTFSAAAANYAISPLWAYYPFGGSYSPVFNDTQTMDPWTGYWLYTFNAATLVIAPPALAPTSTSASFHAADYLPLQAGSSYTYTIPDPFGVTSFVDTQTVMIGAPTTIDGVNVIPATTTSSFFSGTTGSSIGTTTGVMVSTSTGIVAGSGGASAGSGSSVSTTTGSGSSVSTTTGSAVGNSAGTTIGSTAGSSVSTTTGSASGGEVGTTTGSAIGSDVGTTTGVTTAGLPAPVPVSLPSSIDYFSPDLSGGLLQIGTDYPNFDLSNTVRNAPPLVLLPDLVVGQTVTSSTTQTQTFVLTPGSGGTVGTSSTTGTIATTGSAAGTSSITGGNVGTVETTGGSAKTSATTTGIIVSTDGSTVGSTGGTGSSGGTAGSTIGSTIGTTTGPNSTDGTVAPPVRVPGPAVVTISQQTTLLGFITLTVPAGTFNNVAEIHYVQTTYDSSLNIQSIMDHLVFLAPGVGIIQDRSNTLPGSSSVNFGSSIQTLQLSSYTLNGQILPTTPSPV